MKTPEQMVRDNDAKQIKGLRKLLRDLKEAYQVDADFFPFYAYIVVLFVAILFFATVGHAQLTPEQEKAKIQLEDACRQIGCTVKVVNIRTREYL